VLDGLDECDKTHRKVILDAFTKLMPEPTKHLKIFIASRPIDEIQGHFNPARDFQADTMNTVGDIKTYINQSIKEYDDWNDPEMFEPSPETKELILKTLTGEIGERSNGSPM
jgi:hypothetical protein